MVWTIATLAKAIEERKIDRAQAASMEEKMLDGPRLFSLSCEQLKQACDSIIPKQRKMKFTVC